MVLVSHDQRLALPVPDIAPSLIDALQRRGSVMQLLRARAQASDAARPAAPCPSTPRIAWHHCRAVRSGCMARPS